MSTYQIVVSDRPVFGLYSANVCEPLAMGARRSIAEFKHADRKTVSRWAHRFAAGWLDIEPERRADEPPPEAEPDADAGILLAEDEPPASKAAKALADANGIDLAHVHYTGSQITKPEVEAHILAHSRAGIVETDDDSPDDDDSPSDRRPDTPAS